MGRPNCYTSIARADHLETGLESELLLIENMYGLQSEGQWLAIVSHNPYTDHQARRYKKLMYPSLQQARTAQARIAQRYNIQAEIVKLKGEPDA